LNKNLYFVGLDISAADFTVSILQNPALPIKTQGPFLNSSEGFEIFKQWLSSHHVNTKNSIFCLEATGVYGEHLCYWLNAQGFNVAVEPPLKVKRSFDTKGHKTDKIDSRQIAEYAFRFHDELKFWQPRLEVIEQIKVLLAAREQFVQQRTADMNH
jgi:transposase